MPAEIGYARSGGVAISYQVFGAAEVDLADVPDFSVQPRVRLGVAALTHLLRAARALLSAHPVRQAGTGLSDHGAQFATLETRIDDLRAVLDAVGSSSVVVLGSHEGVAWRPCRCRPPGADAGARALPAGRARRGTDDRATQLDLSELRERWGTQAWCDELLQEICPRLYANDDDRSWFANWLRAGASPQFAYALNRAHFETDLSDVLPAIRVPTLVLYRRTPFGTEEHALDVAGRISGARAVRVSGDDYWGLFLSLEIADEIERLVAGEQAPSVPTSVLTTVMFTDLVGSTHRASELGDRVWPELLAAHHALVRRELALYRGRGARHGGRRLLRTFDGPARAIRAAQAIVAGLRGLGLDARIGHELKGVAGAWELYAVGSNASAG